MFANGEQGGYWPADPAYLYEDSAGTIPASANGVVGLRVNGVTNKPNAIQATTANKPYLRKTPVSNKFWLDSNTETGALTATFASAMGRRNLMTYSEEMDKSAWTKSGIQAFGSGSVSDAIASPCLLVTADKIVETDVTTSHYIYQVITPVSGASYVFSVFAKKAERAKIYLSVGFDGGGRLGFDLEAGTVLAGSIATGQGGISNIGDGWYRCAITVTTTSTTNGQMRIGIITGADAVVTSYAGDGTSGVYIWGAQIELSSVTTEYQPIIAGASSVLDPTALATTYPQNITASTNCTIACVTAEGVVIADNQTVGTTYNLTPPYGYNGDVLIINRALTAAEKALVTRVMAWNVPTLGSNLVVNGTFLADTDWTKGTGWSISDTAIKSAGTASNLTQTMGVSGNQYRVIADITRTAGTVGAYNGTSQMGATAATKTAAKYAMKTTSTAIGFRGDASFAGTVDNAVIQDIL